MRVATEMKMMLVLIAVVLSAAPARAARHVIHISVDGLNALELERLLAGDGEGRFANFQRLIDEGASTFNARTDFTHTNTLPNHTCMITGRPTSRPAGQPAGVHHGYVANRTPPADWTLHANGNPDASYIASTFDVAHDNGLSTGLYASKNKFVLYDQTYCSAAGAADKTGVDNGPAKIDSCFIDGNPDAVHACFIRDMKEHRFNYVFLHYRNPDSGGHDFGWGSARWADSVSEVDRYLGDIFEMISGDAQLSGNTVVILTADHGGIATSHGNATRWRNYMIPFFVWGAGVDAGADLYELNAGKRMHPRWGRPDYNVRLQPIRNGDSGNLALTLLGLGPIPGSTINLAQDLRVASGKK